MHIRMARGDLEVRNFQLKVKNGDVVSNYTEQLDEIYMTVKKSFMDNDYVFQKRYTAGEILSLGDGLYQYTIQPSDTDNLSFGNYDFDIEIVKDGTLKRTFIGRLELTKESTHARNEVAS